MNNLLQNEKQLYHLLANTFEEGFNYSSNYYGGQPNKKQSLPRGVCMAATAYANHLMQELKK